MFAKQLHIFGFNKMPAWIETSIEMLSLKCEIKLSILSLDCNGNANKHIAICYWIWLKSRMKIQMVCFECNKTFHGFLFPFTDRVHILEDRSLRLENVGLEDIGEYTCEADNAVGAVASTGNLIVYGKLPLI